MRSAERDLSRRNGGLRDTFAVAFGGLGRALRTQRTLRLQAAIAVIVLLVAAWLRLPPTEAAVVVAMVVLVVAAELANTALEALVDLVNPQVHPLAKRAKDLSAAAVLVAAAGAAACGGLVLVPALAVRLGLAADAGRALAWLGVLAGAAAFLAVAGRAGRSG